MKRISLLSLIDFFWFAVVAGFGATLLITIALAAVSGGPDWNILISYNTVDEGIPELLLAGFILLWLPRIFLLHFFPGTRAGKVLGGRR